MKEKLYLLYPTEPPDAFVKWYFRDILEYLEMYSLIAYQTLYSLHIAHQVF